jgi:peptidoglycan/LPS O-acetylase OafA/YrhL
MVHLWSRLADAGWMGADLFFVLSGFLITGILFDTAHRPDRARNFYARRALRIFPLFYGVLFAILLLTPILGLYWKAGHLLYFLYLSNMVPVLSPALPPLASTVSLFYLWSLAVEEQFYLLWPIVVWLVRDRCALLRVSGGIMICTLLLRIILVARGVEFAIVYTLLVTRADSLICGGALALLVRGPRAEMLPVRWVLPISAAAVLSVFAIAGTTVYISPLTSTLGYSFVAIFCACLVYLAQQSKGWFATIASQPWLRFFGRYSYGLYIFHGLLVTSLLPLVYPIQRLVGSVFLGGILALLLFLALSLAMAMISYQFFEAPILRLKKRFG